METPIAFASRCDIRFYTKLRITLASIMRKCLYGSVDMDKRSKQMGAEEKQQAAERLRVQAAEKRMEADDRWREAAEKRMEADDRWREAAEKQMEADDRWREA